MHSPVLHRLIGKLGIRHQPAFGKRAAVLVLGLLAVTKLLILEIVETGLYVQNGLDVGLKPEFIVEFCLDHDELPVVPCNDVHLVRNAVSLDDLVRHRGVALRLENLRDKFLKWKTVGTELGKRTAKRISARGGNGLLSQKLERVTINIRSGDAIDELVRDALDDLCNDGIRPSRMLQRLDKLVLFE